MAIRTISSSRSKNSGDLKDGNTFTYEEDATNSGVVSSSLYDVNSATIKLKVKYCNTQHTFYFDIYIGSTKVAETVELKSRYKELLEGGTSKPIEETYDLEEISSDILSATGPIKLKVHNNGSKESFTINFRSGEATIKVDYSKKTSAPSAPRNPSLSESTVGPGDSITLEWDEPASTGTGNSISKYKISYSTSRNGTYTNLTSSTDLSETFNAPITKGTYYYKIQTIGTASGYTSGGSVICGPLTVTYNDVSKVTDFKINDKTSNIYITNNDTINLSWTEAEDASYNKVTGYIIQKSTFSTGTFSSMEPITSSSYSENANKAGLSYYYKIITQGEHNNSEATSALGAISISTPVPPTIDSNSYNTTVKSNINLRWTAPSAITGATYTYKIAYTISDGDPVILENNYNSTSYTFNINTIPENGTFTLNVATVAQSTNGGSLTSSYANTSTITRAPSFTIPNKFWLHCYDPDNTDENGKTGLQPYGHNKVYLQWAPLTDTGNSFTYTLKYRKINESSWTEVLNKTTATSATISLANKEGGDVFVFKIDVTDSYGSEQSSDYPSTFTKIKIPTLENLTVRDIKYPSGNISYDWNFSDNSNGKLKCEGFLYYGNDYVSLFSETYDTGKTQKTITKDFNYNLKTSGTSSAVKDNLYNSLYTAVITNKNCYPEGKIRVKLSSVNFPECYKEEWKDFTYDYVTSITVGTLSFTKIHEGNYYNPEDTVKISFTPATFYDASGGSSGATISYKLEGNGGSWTNFTKESNGEFSCEDVAPKANEDLSITYTLTAFAQYADTNKTYISNSTNDKSDSNKINIARWNQNDLVYLSSVQKEGTKVSGSLVISGDLCSSVTHKNIQTITYSLINAETRETILLDQELSTSYSDDLISKNFDFTHNTEGNLSVYAEVIFTNSSNKEIKKVTTTYLLRPTGVPLAIRKGRIGINVDSSSFINESDPLKNSALYIAADSDAASILELSASSNAKNPSFINFLKGKNDCGTIFFNEVDSCLHCNKWYYPVTEVNGQTGEIKLTALDVGARPNTWMPTAGNGISINQEKIINSGILDIFPSTNFTDNYGKITFYKTINDSVTNTSKTEKIAIPISGFAKLSNPYIFDSLSIEGLAEKEPIHLFFRTKEVGDSATDTRISVYNNSSTTQDMIIQCSSKMFIGNGESAFNCYEDKKENTNTNLFFTSDNNINFFTNCGTYTERKECYIDMSGQFYSKGIRGDAIRYGSNTPTDNLVVGQIWLKPKN